MHTSGAPSTEIALPSAGNNICFWALEQVPSVWQQWWAGVQHGRQQEGKKKRKKKNCFRSLHLYYVYWIWFKRSWHQRFAQKFIMWEARAYFIVHPGKGLAETTLNWEGFFFSVFLPLVKKQVSDGVYATATKKNRAAETSATVRSHAAIFSFPEKDHWLFWWTGLWKLTSATQQSAAAPNLFPRLLRLEIRRQMDGSRWNKAGNCIRTSLWKAIRSILHLCTAPIWPSWVLDFDLQSWPPPPSWLMDRPTAYPSSRAGPVMNEYVLYQPCITSWSIVLFHPTNLSFSQRLINYELGSVSNYDLIANQFEPTTPPIYAAGEPGWGFFLGRCTSRWGITVSVIYRHFFSFWLGDHGKVFRHGISITLGKGVSDGCERRKSKAATEWNFVMNV